MEIRLIDRSNAAGCAAKLPPAELDHVLARLPKNPFTATRLLNGVDSHEDAAVVRLLAGADQALVQTLDFFPPIVNDPYSFGQVAACNALSDVYAMGGVPWCAMNIVCFPINDLPGEVLSAILAGGADKIAEAGAVLAGGHSVNDPEIKYGLSVTGFVSATSFAANTELKPGQRLILTKRLGTGILATAIKARWEGCEECEKLLVESAARLNAGPAAVIRALELKAATDITGFGLGGHLLEMATASNVRITLRSESIPALPGACELASIGLLPAGSFANRRYREPETLVEKGVDPILVDLVFDAQTSGGLVLAVPENRVDEACAMLTDSGDYAFIIGETESHTEGPHLVIKK